VTRAFLPAVCLAAVLVAYPSAQSDLDSLMSEVLSHRDENWKKLQQYTLNERETLQITALAVFRLFGYERDYLWFPREGFFVRSPLKADGVVIDDDKRRHEEDQWLKNVQNAEKQRKKGEKVIQDPDADAGPPKGSNVIDLMAALKKSLGEDKGGTSPRKAAAKKPAPRHAPKKAPAKKSAGGRKRA